MAKQNNGIQNMISKITLFIKPQQPPGMIAKEISVIDENFIRGALRYLPRLQVHISQRRVEKHNLESYMNEDVWCIKGPFIRWKSLYLPGALVLEQERALQTAY